MKKYLVIYASCLELEGLDASVKVFDSKEEAEKDLTKTYDFIMSNDVKNYSFDCNTFDGSSYSIYCTSPDGYWEKYEAYIDTKEF